MQVIIGSTLSLRPEDRMNEARVLQWPVCTCSSTVAIPPRRQVHHLLTVNTPHLVCLDLLLIPLSGKGLAQLTTESLTKGLQVTEANPMLGVESRANLLRGLGQSLLAHPDIFGETGRPGNAVGKFHTWDIVNSGSSILQITY